MARRPNYGQQRAERTRAKQAKRDEKLRLRQELAAKRKADDEPAGETPASETEKNPAD